MTSYDDASLETAMEAAIRHGLARQVVYKAIADGRAGLDAAAVENPHRPDGNPRRYPKHLIDQWRAEITDQAHPHGRRPPSEAAALAADLGIHYVILCRRLHDGTIPALKAANGTWHSIDREAAKSYFDQHKH